jgi:hypothetical protein
MKALLLLALLLLPACARDRVSIDTSLIPARSSAASIKVGVTNARKQADTMARTALTSEGRDYAEAFSFALHPIEVEADTLTRQLLNAEKDFTALALAKNETDAKLRVAHADAEKATAAIWRRNWLIVALLVWVFRTPLMLLGRGALRLLTGVPL